MIFKVAMVGGFVGKTSLMKRFEEKQYPGDFLPIEFFTGITANFRVQDQLLKLFI